MMMWFKAYFSSLRGAIWLGSLVALLMGLAVYQARADQARLAPSADTFVASGRPTENLGLNPSLWVGHDQAGGYLEERALLGFNADLPVGSTIASAKLWLYLSGTTTGDAPLAVQAYRVRSGWAESSTWNDHLGLVVDGAPAASVSVPAALGWYAWDVTTALQAWSDARDTADFSLLLRSDVTSGQHERGFWSQDCSPADCGSDRPYLEIAYDLPTATPTATLPPSPTATPRPLAVTLSQSRGVAAQLVYTIQVANPAAQVASAVVVTNPLPAGMEFVSAANGGALVGGEVRWAPGNLAAGGNQTLTFTVRPARPVTAAAGGEVTVDLIGEAAVSGEPPAATAPDAAAIKISKKTTTPKILYDDAASFTIAVTNTGTVKLTDVTVSDPLAPNCDRNLGDLEAGAAHTPYNCVRTNVTADFTNQATVTGNKPSPPGGTVTASASAAVDVINPAIVITKTTTTPQIISGGTATFSIKVTNSGDVALSEVVVSDPEASNCDKTITTLAKGASSAYTCSRTSVTDDFTNEATVTGRPPVGANVTASDSVAVDVIHPAIVLSKAPATQQVVSHDTAIFTIAITNTGDITLTNVTVSDPLAPDCKRTIGVLAAGVSYPPYTCTRANVVEDFENQATVTGKPPVGPNVSASDTAVVDVIYPSLRISKQPDLQQVVAGGTARFTLVITNTGDVRLTNVTVSDPLAPGCSRTIAALAVGASSGPYACTRTAVTADFTNEATVTGTPPVGAAVSAADSAVVQVLNPAIMLGKGPAVQPVVAGGMVTFTLAITNTGPVTLTNVVVSDPLTVGCKRTIGTLAAGASYGPYTCTRTNVTADFTNEATVSGRTPTGATVSSASQAVVQLIHPALALSKTPATQQVIAGSAANFTVVITNTGDVALTGVTVSDPLAPDCNRTIGALAAGGSYPYTCMRANVAADFTNVATVTGQPPVGPAVSAAASAAVQVIHPAIRLSKTTTTPQIVSGDIVTFTLAVENTGDVALAEVVVDDPLAPDCNRTIGTLAIGAGYPPYSCTRANVTAGFTNVATATGRTPAGAAVSDRDSAIVQVFHPAIQISKTPTTQSVVAGGTVTFTLAVTNTGPIALTGVTVSDPRAPACNRTIGALAAGARYGPYTCTRANVTTDFTNVATVTGQPPVGAAVMATSSAVVDVIRPAIAISKQPATQAVGVYGTARFTITVTNTGDAALTGVKVSDLLAPNCNRTIGVLAAGASWSHSCTRANITDDFINVATVTGQPPAGPAISASASAEVRMLMPTVVNRGACVSWRYGDGVTRTRCSAALIFNGFSTWLPLVLR